MDAHEDGKQVESRAHGQPHGRKAEHGTRVAPEADLLEVLHIVFTLILFEPLPQFVYILFEGVVVEVD